MSTSGEAHVDAYIAGFPPEVRDRLAELRRVIVEHLPGSTQTIRYDMPAVMLGDRYGIHFAGWKKHVALYPVPVFDDPLESRITPYRSGRDTVKFLHALDLPYDLVADICDQLVARRMVDPA